MPKSASPAQPFQRQAPMMLWRAAQALITAVFNLFGAPQEIAAQRTLTKEARALLLAWLRAGEAMVRRLIFIEARKICQVGPGAPPAPLRKNSAPLGGRPPANAAVFDPTQPDSWRVSFRYSAPDHRCHHGRTESRRAPRALYARPLAERCEALLRAFNDPLPCARRLARQLERSPPRHDEPPPNARELYGHEAYDTLDFHYRAAFHGVDTG